MPGEKPGNGNLVVTVAVDFYTSLCLTIAIADGLKVPIPY